jgi:hypothetical protein
MNLKFLQSRLGLQGKKLIHLLCQIKIILVPVECKSSMPGGARTSRVQRAALIYELDSFNFNVNSKFAFYAKNSMNR